MRYEYRDIWVRTHEGEMIGCQMSYPSNMDWVTIQHASDLIHEWLMGDTPCIVLPVGFRLWNPGKIKEPLDTERAAAQEADNGES